MPPWPGTPITTSNMDAPGDSPAAARADIKTTADTVNAILAARGVADGIPELDADGLVPQAQVPITPVLGGRYVSETPGAGSFTVPAGVYEVAGRAKGAGAGGGYTSIGTGGPHGGGGGEGGEMSFIMEVNPGDVINFNIGTAGTGKSAAGDGDGTDGGDTTITDPATGVVYTGKGGLGGKGPVSCFGGAGGYATKTGAGLVDSDIRDQGGFGTSGATKGGTGGGKGVAITTGGTADRGGGAGGFGSGDGNPAFDGTHGRVIFEW